MPGGLANVGWEAGRGEQPIRSIIGDLCFSASFGVVYGLIKCPRESVDCAPKHQVGRDRSQTALDHQQDQMFLHYLLVGKVPEYLGQTAAIVRGVACVDRASGPSSTIPATVNWSVSDSFLSTYC